VTKPFDFEGQKRMKVAENGLAELKGNVDTLIIIPNQNLFKIANEKTTFAEAFKMADDVLYQGICGITDLITNPGMINLDFADIRTVMGNMGKAMMGTGESSGDERAKNAAEAALNNPLLDDSNIKGAKSILLNIKGGPDMALFEVDEAASKIRNEVDENANIIFGSSIDESLEGIIRVSVVATGINNEAIELETDKNVNKENFDNYQLPKNKFNIKDAKENTILEETNINEGIKSELLHNIQSEQSDLEVQIKNLNKNKEINLNFETNNKKENYENTSLTSMDKVELEVLLDKKPNNSFTEKKPENILKRLSTFFNNNKIEEQKVEPNIVNSKFDSINQNKKSVEDLTYDEIQNIELKSENSEDLFNQYKNNDISKHQINLIDIEQNKEGIDENILEIPAFLRRQAN